MNLSKLSAELKKDHEHMNKYWFRRVYWACYRFWHNHVLMVRKNTKWWLQRRIRGYDDQDLWNLYGHIGNHIVKVLKAFKKADRCGVPGIFVKGHTNEQLKEDGRIWEKEIQDMIDGFHYLANGDDPEMELWEEYMKKDPSSDNWIEEYMAINKANYKKAQRKASKMIKYFGNLWD